MHSKVGVEGYKKSIEEAVATGGKIEFGGNVRYWFFSNLFICVLEVFAIFLWNGFIIDILSWLRWTKQKPSYFIKNFLKAKIVPNHFNFPWLSIFRLNIFFLRYFCRWLNVKAIMLNQPSSPALLMMLPWSCVKPLHPLFTFWNVKGGFTSFFL